MAPSNPFSEIRKLEEAIRGPARQLEKMLRPAREIEALTGIASGKTNGSSQFGTTTRQATHVAASGISKEQAAVNDKLETEVARLKLQQSHQQEQFAHQQERMDSINAEVSTHRVYAFIDWEDKYLKIGFSRNFNKPTSGRLATHARNGLEYLSDRYGTQEDEDTLLATLKVMNKQRDDELFTPRRGTQEEFKISRELIDIIVAHNWPLGEGDPYRLLEDHRQRDLGLG